MDYNNREQLISEIEERLGKPIENCSDNEILNELDDMLNEKGMSDLNNIV